VNPVSLFYCRKRSRSNAGVTLIEAVVVIAIISVIAAMAGTAMYRWKERAAGRSASFDFYVELNKARQLALERGSDVWVIVYPKLSSSGGNGAGAYFVYTDPNMDFVSSTCPSGQVCYSTFAPPDASKMYPTAGMGQLEAATFLDQYSSQPLTFADMSLSTKSMKGPFEDLADSGCNFCSGSPLRGAIVFGGEGGARFVDGAGNLTALKTAALAFKDATTQQNTTHIAVARSTGFIEIARP
jgi:prepilin-type N-terminal cleavage/methylation domain-containing protein